MTPDLLRRIALVTLAVALVVGAGAGLWAVVTAGPSYRMPPGCYSDVVDTCEDQRYPGQDP